MKRAVAFLGALAIGAATIVQAAPAQAADLRDQLLREQVRQAMNPVTGRYDTVLQPGDVDQIIFPGADIKDPEAGGRFAGNHIGSFRNVVWGWVLSPSECTAPTPKDRFGMAAPPSSWSQARSSTVWTREPTPEMSGFPLRYVAPEETGTQGDVTIDIEITEDMLDRWLCAYQYWIVKVVGTEASDFFAQGGETGEETTGYTIYRSQPVVGKRVQRPSQQQTMFARAPYASSLEENGGIYPGALVSITGQTANNLFGESVTGRALRIGYTSTATPLSCDYQSEHKETVDITAGGSLPTSITREVPAGTAGKYLCLQQGLRTDRTNGEMLFSEPVTVQVGRATPSVPQALNLGTALERLTAATQRLQRVQGQPNVDQAALAAAAAEAEEARRQAEAAAARAQARAAQAQAQGQAAPAGAPSAAQIAQVQQAAEAATAAVEQAIGGASAGAGRPTALTALATATGFDPFTTPVLQAREKNGSGVSIEVTAPDSIQQKKRLFTKLDVKDPVTRGGMRQYLLDLNGPTPRLLLKRSGFVPDGVENKRYWISKNFAPGTYGLLTTFMPSTPGMQGVAVYDTIEVTEAPTKKKKKGKKKNRN